MPESQNYRPQSTKKAQNNQAKSVLLHTVANLVVFLKRTVKQVKNLMGRGKTEELLVFLGLILGLLSVFMPHIQFGEGSSLQNLSGLSSPSWILVLLYLLVVILGLFRLLFPHKNAFGLPFGQFLGIGIKMISFSALHWAILHSTGNYFTAYDIKFGVSFLFLSSVAVLAGGYLGMNGADHRFWQKIIDYFLKKH